MDITAPVGDNGMITNYIELKKRAQYSCKQLDEYTLLPKDSPFLNISEEASHYKVIFNDETLYFAKSDTLLLPIRNATVEELSHHLLQDLVEIYNQAPGVNLYKLTVRVSSGPGQSGSSEWTKES